MEGDTLYTVKYYKGRKEFYRYTPKENPAIKVFPHPNMRIEVRWQVIALSLSIYCPFMFSHECNTECGLLNTYASTRGFSVQSANVLLTLTNHINKFRSIAIWRH